MEDIRPDLLVKEWTSRETVGIYRHNITMSRLGVTRRSAGCYVK
jgi:hypothetical protein